MSQRKQKRGKKESKHWPTLSTVLMVEDTLKKEGVISVAELKKKLPRQVNHNSLMLILEYLEESNKVLMTLKGLTWIHKSNPNLNKGEVK